MSRLRDVEQHLRSLADIREIMNSMKSLAYMETRKLQRIVSAQGVVTGQIEKAAADFLQFHPETLPAGSPARPVHIVFGTERGFCGNLNERLVARLTEVGGSEADEPVVIAVGRRLHTVLRNRPIPNADLRCIEGAGVTEEASAVLALLTDELAALQEQHDALSVSGLYHGSETEIVSRDVLPPFGQSRRAHADAFMHPPLLNLEPEQLLLELTDQYVLSVLFEMLFASLRSENLHRVTHLTGAVRHLDESTSELARRANTLRQEEITEEIEVILLSASTLIDTEPAK